MNKYQKILTIVALVVFSAIIALHYYDLDVPCYYYNIPQWGTISLIDKIKDVRMPLFVLGVLYAGSMGLAMRRRAP